MPGPPVSRAPDSGPKDRSLDWHFLQCFGERLPDEDVQDADIISAMEFDAKGEHLATGDRGGRVVLFEKVPHRRRQNPDRAQSNVPCPSFEFKYLTEFQSHVPEFDYLKSLEVDEKINKVKWFRSHPNHTRMLLSTNDKTIKLWRVFEKKVHHMARFNVRDSNDLIGTQVVENWGPASGDVVNMGKGVMENIKLRMPEVVRTEKVLTSQCWRLYANAHAYNINSVSINSDGETFLSSDDLRIYLWNMEISHTSFNFVDMKPDNMEELSEVITSCECHPRHCNIFGYSSSKGLVRLVDMRLSALCDGVARVLSAPDRDTNQGVFSEIITSISDMKFGRDGNSLIVRDYMTLKVWDLRMEREVVSTFKVHEELRPKLCELYENDSIFDKFTCAVSPSGQEILTGSYGGKFAVFRKDGMEQRLEASWTPMVPSKRDQNTPVPVRACVGGFEGGGMADSVLSKSELQGKISQLAWHPKENVVAVGACNSLFLFHSGDRA
ncbi:hypothetical protein BSKO_07945 [Bryopsis sp. KO-2023]|nr:hypothetical protein BSKO_07945 [Bryopsis sp. KO-2023]